jgi:hypothetical protein
MESTLMLYYSYQVLLLIFFHWVMQILKEYNRFYFISFYFTFCYISGLYLSSLDEVSEEVLWRYVWKSRKETNINIWRENRIHHISNMDLFIFQELLQDLTELQYKSKRKYFILISIIWKLKKSIISKICNVKIWKDNKML